MTPNKLHQNIDYPLARLQGIVDTGATFTMRRSSTYGTLHGELASRSGARHAQAEGPDMNTVAAKLVMAWGHLFPRSWQPQLTGTERWNAELRPHMRAALGELGALHGRRRARGEETNDQNYRSEGCQCDYCSAFDHGRTCALAELAAPVK